MLGALCSLAVLAVAAITEAAGLSRPYHPVEIGAVASTQHTHVCVTGRAAIVKREPDGDLHVRLEDSAGRFIVAEEIPGLKASGRRPRIDEAVTACGISRYDKKHGWYEVHPVERWLGAKRR